MRNIKKKIVFLQRKIKPTITMKTATAKIIEQSEKVGLYSIRFNDSDITEYEKFVQKFMSDATLNEDFKKVFRALNRIVANGALERYFRPEGHLRTILQHYQ